MKQTKQPGAKYLARAQALAAAIDIGLSLYCPMEEPGGDRLYSLPLPEEQIASHRASYLELKQKALSPEPPFANLRSLAYLENAFFTEWNEGAGQYVERFWQLAAERGLPFERKDVVRQVLDRGRISNEAEYHTIVDSLVVLEQIGKITPDEAGRLSKIIGSFEKRGARRPR